MFRPFFQVCLLVAGVLVSLPAEARRNGPFGAGVILGDPAGLSAKYFQGRHAIDFALDFSFRHEGIYIHSDYLIDLGLINHRELHSYVGIGGKLRLAGDHHHNHDDRLAARVPFGIAWEPQKVSIDVFLELVPVMAVYPDLGPSLDGGLGVRYYF